MSGVAVLLLAGGASARMRGRDKLLEDVGGEALLRRQARAALDCGVPVIVAVPPEASARRAALDGLAASVVEVPGASRGMGHTLAGAAAAAPEGAAMLVMLADMPEIGTPELRQMLEAHRDVPAAVVRGAAEDGTPGHPVLFPARLRPALMDLSGDEGARSILGRERPRLVSLPARAALTDLDTPEAWAAWRAGETP